MPKYSPSQYECDNMEPGDVISIKERSFMYKLTRRLFQKDKLILKIKKDKDSDEYVYPYQEDCTILYSWDLQALQVFDDQIPCLISNHPDKHGKKLEILKSVRIGLVNVQLVFKNNKTFTIPTAFFNDAIEKNKNIVKNIKNDKMIQESIKYQRYKGDYFKRVVSDNNIEKWNSSYCYLCGKPVTFEFNEDRIHIDNQCTCGKNKLSLDSLSYDEFALWYATSGEDNKRYYKDFWFKEGTDIKNES